MSHVSSFDQYRSLRSNEASSTHTQSVGPLFRSEHQFPQSSSLHAELTSDRKTELFATTERDRPRSTPVGWMSAITRRSVARVSSYSEDDTRKCEYRR